MLATLVGPAGSLDFKVCTSSDHAHVKTITAYPDPPVHGQDVDINVSATPDVAITAGTVKVDVTAYGIPVPDTPTFDLCTAGKNGAGFSCPTTAGQPVLAKVTYGISKLVPAGIDATIKLSFLDGSSTMLGCVTFDVEVGDASSSGGLVGATEHSVEGEPSHLNPFAAARKLETAELPAAAVEARAAAAKEAVAPALAAAKAKAAAVLASPASKGAAAPSALATLLRAPAAAPEAEQREMLKAAYDEQPEWGRLFGAWREQAKKPAYATAAEEGRRFANFKQAILRLDASKGAKADEHSDKSADELRSFAHFA